jgi:hypothetical protein
MKFQSPILAFTLAVFPIICLSAEPTCEFEDPSHRIISGTNPDDFRCIKLLAAAGDEHWQYYLGLILTGQVAGPNNPSEGLAVLKQVALRKNKYSADAMRFIGYLYMRPDTPLFDYELAYQWLYLASQQSPFKGTTYPLPNEKLNVVITSKRMRELESSANSLLQNR